MTDSKVAIEEVRILTHEFTPLPEGLQQGETEVYVLLATDDHIGCPHFVPGWHRHVFPAGVNSLQIIEHIAHNLLDEVIHWPHQSPPENEYGRQIMEQLAKVEAMTFGKPDVIG